MNILEYEIPIKDKFDLLMPKDSEILSFQSVGYFLKLWILAKEDVEEEIREFKLFRKGLFIKKDELSGYKFVGTAQKYSEYGGSFVLHLFVKETLHDIIEKKIDSMF
jgi:hypothetical protein